MRLSDYFDRTFVLNLPDRADRRREIGRVLERAGMPWEPGRVELFPATRPESQGPFPSIGARGAFLSHLAMLRRARELGLSRVLLLEDDLELSPQLSDSVGPLVDRLRHDDWDIVYLGHDLKLPPPSGACELILYDGPIMLAHFYGVHGRILDRLIAFLELVLSRPGGHPDGGPMHVDAAILTFRAQSPNVTTLVASPSQGWQRSSRSDIAANRWYDRNPISRGFVGLARRLTRRWRGATSRIRSGLPLS
jgi:glycosyl transferase family 25